MFIFLLSEQAKKSSFCTKHHIRHSSTGKQETVRLTRGIVREKRGNNNHIKGKKGTWYGKDKRTNKKNGAAKARFVVDIDCCRMDFCDIAIGGGGVV